MDVQSRYWQEFTDLKRDAFYVALYQAEVEQANQVINIVTAVTSSSSIAGWAVWSQFSIVWATIIAASQVLTAVKPVLPFRARLKALAGLSSDLDGLAITAETDWFKVGTGVLTEEEIHTLTMQLKRKKLAVQTKRFADMSLPPKPRLLARAESDARAYMMRIEGDDADAEPKRLPDPTS